jgi:hypothetical protein
MALVPTVLKTAIKNALLANCPNPNTEQSSQINTLATSLATAIDAYIKSATVTVPSGVLVATTGTAVAQTGATTAPGIGTIS